MEIIAAIGAGVVAGLQTHPFDPDFRKKSLELQKTAVEALLQAVARPRRGLGAGSSPCSPSAWLAEAEFSHQFDDSTSLGPRMQRDPFGNMFFVNDDGMSPG